jgi:D-alanyl-lipoteichoic acid acyltransferase DltB (MBOAT superfamily)
VAFAGQILCDFAGYSTCAIGAAMCLGFWLPQNFRYPYAAVGFSDFWRRWHISLSSWFRDYLYIPLGGSAGTLVRTCLNQMTTMLLVGLWHGASWSFVVWGGIHGLYLIVERLLKRLVPVHPSRHWFSALPVALVTFALGCVAGVFFRADSIDHAILILKVMFGQATAPSSLSLSQDAVVKVILVMGILLAVQWLMRSRQLEEVVEQWSWWVRSLVLTGLLVGIVVLSGEDRAFIYFQF